MLNHLLELRQRLLVVVIVYCALFGLFYYFSEQLFALLMSPLIKVLPANSTLVTTKIMSPILTPLRLAGDAALFTVTPFVFWQCWRFILPGLYEHERKFFYQLICTGWLLFCLGILFCFYLVLPFMLQLFAAAVPAGVRMMPDMTDALNFIIRMLLVFGVCFQIPLACLALVQMQWLTIAGLKEIRPYVIVSAFIIGMLLTPPDVFSQIMLAVPLCFLYELGILLAARKNVFAKNKLSKLKHHY